MEPKKFEATFIWEKSTKNTERFQEETANSPPKIGVLYVQKFAIGKKAKHLKVTVEELE